MNNESMALLTLFAATFCPIGITYWLITRKAGFIWSSAPFVMYIITLGVTCLTLFGVFVPLIALTSEPNPDPIAVLLVSIGAAMVATVGLRTVLLLLRSWFHENTTADHFAFFWSPSVLNGFFKHVEQSELKAWGHQNDYLFFGVGITSQKVVEYEIYLRIRKLGWEIVSKRRSVDSSQDFIASRQLKLLGILWVDNEKSLARCETMLTRLLKPRLPDPKPYVGQPLSKSETKIQKEIYATRWVIEKEQVEYWRSRKVDKSTLRDCSLGGF